MKREFLKQQGLTDDQINAIMAENGKEVNSLKDQVTSLTSEKDELTNQLSDRDSQLKGLKDQVKDSDELTAKIDELQKANKQAHADYQAKLASQDKHFKITNALRDSGAKNVKAVEALLDLDKVSVDDNGALIGLNDQLGHVKESDAYLFNNSQTGDNQAGKVTITNGQPSQGASDKPTTGLGAVVANAAKRLAEK